LSDTVSTRFTQHTEQRTTVKAIIAHANLRNAASVYLRRGWLLSVYKSCNIQHDYCC